MRRPLVALTVLSCFGLAACEDGPAQTYSPAPANAGNNWNDGQTPPATDPGQQGFGTQGGGNNKMQICTGSQEATRWAAMVKDPIVPPTQGGGLDLSGGNSWVGLTIEQAEQINCQSTNAGDQFGDGTQVNYWGDNGELWVDYNVSNHKIYFMTFWPGYLGSISMKSRDGQHSYEIYVNQQSTKDGNPYEIDWLDPVKFPAQVNELYDALTATFASGLPQDNACTLSGACITGNFGDVAYMYFPAIGTGFWIASRTAAQPTPSIFNRIDQYLAKTMPFSLAAPLFKLGDTDGPIATAGKLGSGTWPACTLQMGMTFGDFKTSCLNVDSTTADNTIEMNKLVGGMTHDTESYTFDVQGVDLNFKAGNLGPTSIVLDSSMPQDSDLANNFDVDQATLGAFANDHVNNDPSQPKDIHGSGLVYLEYARLVQDALNADMAAQSSSWPNFALGEPSCLLDPVTGNGVDPNTLAYPLGCTGFEGFVTAAPPSSLSAADANLAPLAVGTYVATHVNSSMALGLKPGHPAATFCLDPSSDLTVGKACTAPTDCTSGICNAKGLCNIAGDTTGGSACAADTDCASGACNGAICAQITAFQGCQAPYGAEGDIFATSFNRVLNVLGGGNVASLPLEAQDVRFFWKQYVTALVKYMLAVGNPNTKVAGMPTADEVHAQFVDPDGLFFDSVGAGQFETGEYIDRSAVTMTNGPIDINIEADVKNGIFDEYMFSKALYRGETAIYTTMLETPNPPTQSYPLGGATHDNVLLTNIFGSPVLKAGWQPGTTHSAYQCATDLTYPADCGGQIVPKNADGTARLLNYPGAFVGTQTAFSLGPTNITVVNTYPTIQQAAVSIPLYSDPYAWSADPNTGALSNSSTQMALPNVLVPWAPKQPGVGFPIAITGTLDKFIETSQIDFSGTTITANVDYDAVIDPTTGQPAADGSIQFLAVETSDFLGEVFLCQDPATGDVLGARMYEPVATILDWLGSHPGTYTSCGIIITYSPYANYADYITSLTAGVRLNITQGGGFGRVVDTTLFVPGQ